MPKDLPAKHRLFALFTAFAVAICLAMASSDASDHSVSTPEQVFGSMRSSFQPAKAKGVHAKYQWSLSGPDGGDWWIDVNDGGYKMGKGRIANPNVTFLAKARDWVAISNGQLNGNWAYLTGRLKIRGNQRLAKKLGQMFP
jgi:putative sterol carrier protein